MIAPDAKPHRIPIEPLRWEANDPLAAEHELVAQFVSETVASGWRYYPELDINLTGAGRKILESEPETGARLVRALVAYSAHFDDLQAKVKALAKSESERVNWHHTPEWEAIWLPRQVAAAALRRLMRRKLPLTTEHLIQMADWFAITGWLNDRFVPLKSFVKTVEASGKITSDDTALRTALTRVIERCRKGHEKELPKIAHQLETLLADAREAQPMQETEVQPPPAGPDSSQPALAGSAQVLVQLKQHLGILPDDELTGTETIGYDHFPLRADSPLKAEHEMINMLLPEVVERPGYDRTVLAQTTAGRAMAARDEAGRGKLLLATAERIVNAQFVPGGGLADHLCWQSQSAMDGIFNALLKTAPKLDRNGFFDLLLFLSAQSGYRWTMHAELAGKLIPRIDAMATQSPLTPGERYVLHRLRCQFVRTCPFGSQPAEIASLNQLLQDVFFMALVPGEAWADAVNRDLGSLPRATRENWLALLQHTATATGSRPSAKWLKITKEHLEKISEDSFRAALGKWFPLVNAPRTIKLLGGGFMSRTGGSGTIHEDNATCLRGLIWMTPGVISSDLIRAIGALTVSCYRKIPGVGPRCVKAGNAGVYALSEVNDPLAVGQLALLKVKVKFGSAQKEIEKAFNAAAERSGLPREELEEMSVPTYGLTDVGISEEVLGEFTARLTITGTNTTELVWVKADGKTQRAVPPSVKASHKEELKELQAAAKDIQQMLPAQRERIDGLFLQQKTWSWAIWRERYLDHALVGTLARRLLWNLRSGNKSTTTIWFQGRLVDFDLKPVNVEIGSTTVELWHPIGKSTDEVVAWRGWLDAQQIQQPFKQAHRELYLLTDAERNTQTYSNRYAAHVVKQHQFNALCALRGWKNKLRLMVDDIYPPATLHLPQWGLRAEFWVEGLGTEYGSDTNDTGVYLHLSTDQVRFYRLGAFQRIAHAAGGGYQPDRHANGDEPLPLEQIPPLVFSEIMRDVDMFVGVASVGNDPTWSDGGPQGRHQEYWQSYSFGELNASAKTRLDVLERLVPKLKIANRCSFADRYLVVKGNLRTYKIHLGSGNILMEPNNQYLCIVPRQGDTEENGVLLPFEGDRTLSIILSKAFLLANDSKIKDETITRQIQMK